jgi:hypothetical protein
MNETTKITPPYMRRLAAQASMMVRLGMMPSLQEFYDAIGQARAQYRLKILAARRQQRRDRNQLEFVFKSLE